jgi:acetyl esterase/lipase
MKQFFSVLTTVILLGFFQISFAQERYLDEIFADVDVTKDVTYGANHSVFLSAIGLGDTMILPQLMDVYEPAGDTVSERPVIIFGVTGTFLPANLNLGFTGERSDLANVEIASRLARMGYVVAVTQYRRGWTFTGNALAQQKTILHAAYRGIQDMRMAVRYFRKVAAEDGNKWRVDVDKVAVGGQGTGGYMAYGATYLEDPAQTFLTKFLEEVSPGVFVPFLDTTLFGDPYGLDTAVLNLPNYPTYSSDFNVGFALGGALGDSSWVRAGAPPFLAMHCYRDNNAPFGVGDVLAVDPTTNATFAVIPNGSGGFSTVGKAAGLGNQDVLNTFTFTDPVSQRAEQLHPDIPGLYSFVTPYTAGDAMCFGVGIPGDTLQEWGDPWNWYDSTTSVTGWDAFWQGNAPYPASVAWCRNNRTSPRTEAAASLYIDTIIAYLAPRLAVTMGIETSVTAIDNLIDDQDVSVYPNPSNGRVSVSYLGTDGKQIDEIKLMDISGRTVRAYRDIRATQFEIQKGELSSGLYMLQTRVGDRLSNKKIVFN